MFPLSEQIPPNVLSRLYILFVPGGLHDMEVRYSHHVVSFEVMLLAVILTGQICVIMNHTLAFDHETQAHLINYLVITGK